MKKVFLVTVLVAGLNGLLVLSENIVLIIAAPLIELIAGIVLAVYEDKRSIGQGILLALALTLLIGYVVCTQHPLRIQ